MEHFMKGSMIIHPDELSKEWVDKLVDAGINTLGINPWGGVKAVDSLKELIKEMEKLDYREIIDYAKARRLEIEYEIHSAGFLMPRELFEEHPEYFRMDEGGNRTKDWNFCFSNEEALEIVAKRAAKLALALYGSSPRFYFWMDDAHQIYCNCEKCIKLSPSDQQLLVLNRILQEIKKYIPNAQLAYLAYMDTIVPPVCVKPENGIFLEYAPFEKYTATGENAPLLIEREKQMIAPLMSFFGSGTKKVLEYWYDNSLYSHWKKPPVKFILNESKMKEDIEEYRSQGFDTISTFACFLGKDYEELYGEVDVKPFAKCVQKN